MVWTVPRPWPPLEPDRNEPWNDHNFHDDCGVRVDRPPEVPEKVAAVVLGAAVAATELKRPVTRRSLLFPWRRR